MEDQQHAEYDGLRATVADWLESFRDLVQQHEEFTGDTLSLIDETGLHFSLSEEIDDLAARLAGDGENQRAEWGHRYPDGSIIPDSSETVAFSRAVISKARGGNPLVLVRRTVTEWREVDLNA